MQFINAVTPDAQGRITLGDLGDPGQELGFIYDDELGSIVILSDEDEIIALGVTSVHAVDEKTRIVVPKWLRDLFPEASFLVAVEKVFNMDTLRQEKLRPAVKIDKIFLRPFFQLPEQLPPFMTGPETDAPDFDSPEFAGVPNPAPEGPAPEKPAPEHEPEKPGWEFVENGIPQ